MFQDITATHFASRIRLIFTCNVLPKPISENTMYNFIIAYIANRMASIGHEKYAFEPFVVVLNENLREQQINGQNEYFFLTSVCVVPGTEISGDNHYFKSEDFYNSLEIGKIQEFTGNIKITCPQCSRQALEFIRVIPQ